MEYRYTFHYISERLPAVTFIHIILSNDPQQIVISLFIVLFVTMVNLAYILRDTSKCRK
jgi:hypothetical protein